MNDYLSDFNAFVSELVNYHIRMNKEISIAYLAEKMGVSNSFVQKAIYTPKEKHFNLKHIFLIAQAMNLSVEDLIPSRENYKLITNKDLPKEDWQIFINELRKENE